MTCGEIALGKMPGMQVKNGYYYWSYNKIQVLVSKNSRKVFIFIRR